MKRAYEKPEFRKTVVTLQAVTAGLKTTGKTDVPSDARLKTDIREVGRTVYDLPLYCFSYIGRKGRFEGVMAQDVLKTLPGAVSIGQDGYFRVNYPMLGIEMKRVS
jgi:hypothetical protein